MSDTQLIKDKIDIAELIGEYVQLKKAGANWKGCCPFHSEKSPSFMVHPEKQIWHCFGCSKGGDIFSFLEEIEGIEFTEALKILADKAGVQLTNYKPEVNKNKKNRIYDVNQMTANFFHQFLLKMSASKEAKDYLEKRGLSEKIIEEFKVGFIPEQWRLLTDYLVKKGKGIDDMISAGVVIKKDGANVSTGRGFYDRFRGRIMFPIWDIHGNVVGFTGRQLVENKEAGGKYVNSPETAVYDKSRVLYGLNFARQPIRKEDLAVVVEGQMDVIACHQVDMKNVVASSGTALTVEQIKLIKRYTKNIVFAFDSDQAGEKAAKRGIDMAVKEGMDVKIVEIPEGAGKDADECIQKDKEVWFKAIKDASGVMDWYFKKVLSKYDVTNPKEKQQIATELLQEIIKIPYPVERDEYIKRLSNQVGISLDVLKEEIKNINNNQVKKVGVIKKTEPVVEKTVQKKTIPNKLQLTYAHFWSLVLKKPEIFKEVADLLKSEYFSDSKFLTLYDLVNKEYNNTQQLNIDRLRENFKDESENLIDILLLQAVKDFSDLSDNDIKEEIVFLAKQIKSEWIKNRREELNLLRKQAKLSGNKEEEDKLFVEMSNL